jgi:hypothetical protein
MGLEILQEAAQASGPRALAVIKGVLSPSGRLMGENDLDSSPGDLLVASGQNGIDLFVAMIVAGRMAQAARVSGDHTSETNKTDLPPHQGRAMQHLKARLFPEIGDKIFMVHISGYYKDRGANFPQSKRCRTGGLPTAAIMQVSAKGYQIGINSPQPAQHGPAIVKIRQSYDPEWSLYACHSPLPAAPQPDPDILAARMI